jgi:hypothetical protein
LQTGVDLHPGFPARFAEVCCAVNFHFLKSFVVCDVTEVEPADMMWCSSGTWLRTLLSCAVLLCCVPAFGRDRWVVQEQRGSLLMYSEFEVDTERMWAELGEVDSELSEATGIRATAGRVEIVLFASRQSYLQYLSASVPQAAARRAIFLKNGEISQIYAYNSRSLVVDLRHELTHVRVHQHLPYAPLWLDEGLAEYFEEEEAARPRSSRREAVRWKARVGISPTLSSLERIRSAESMGAEEYRNSWAWVCFLINDSAVSRQVLQNYVRQIHRGEAPGRFSEYAAAENSDVLSRANSYFRKMTFPLTFASSEE